MEKIPPLHRLLASSRHLPLLVISLGLLILAAIILVATLQLREQIRRQIAGRDGEILHAVALTLAEDPEVTTFGSIEDPANQLTVVLKTSRLRRSGDDRSWGVMAALLFDPEGRFVDAFPVGVLERRLSADDLERLRALQSVSHYRPAVRWPELFLPDASATTVAEGTLPILEVNVPLHAPTGQRLVGIAQFIIEGHSLVVEFARLDRNLILQALAALLVSGTLLSLVIAWAFRRLRLANRLLAERTDNLLKANQELTLAAKTSALGAVTAHLIHGLKSPLSGLQHFVKSGGGSHAQEAALDWEQAAASTRRMQALINQVVNILREEKVAASYEVTPSELVQLISDQLAPLARERQVRFTATVQAEAVWPNRVANLVGLILLNLLQNAVQATPQGREVSLRLTQPNRDIFCEVRDQGAGLPPDLELFAPCPSTKEGGAGIGLAVSKQLANHLGAKLELKQNSPSGCTFLLTLPTPNT